MAQGQESEAEIWCSSKDNQERIMVKVNKQKDKRRVILFGIPLGTVLWILKRNNVGVKKEKLQKDGWGQVSGL